MSKFNRRDYHLMLEEPSKLANHANLKPFVVFHSDGSRSYEVWGGPEFPAFYSGGIQFVSDTETNAQQFIQWQASRKPTTLLAKLARVKIQVRRPQPVRFPVVFRVKEAIAA